MEGGEEVEEEEEAAASALDGELIPVALAEMLVALDERVEPEVGPLIPLDIVAPASKLVETHLLLTAAG